MANIGLGINRSYQIAQCTDAIAITLSEMNGAAYPAGQDPTWQLDVYAGSPEGKDYVGTINTVAARNGKFPSRIVAYAICPGAESWNVEATGPSTSGNPENPLQAFAELRARPAQCCSGLGAGIYRPRGRSIINGHLVTEVGSGTTAPLAASRVDFTAPIAFSGAFGSNESSAPAGTFWVMFFNSTTIPANGTEPYEGLAFDVGAGSTFNFVAPENGLFLSQGLCWAVSSTPGTLTLSTQLARVVTICQW